jgi:hypothetical protein
MKGRPRGSGGRNDFLIGEDFRLRLVEPIRCSIRTSGALMAPPRGQ